MKSYFYEVKYTVKPGMRDTFIQQIIDLGIGTKSRKEQGNRKYEYVVPAEDKDTLLLYEIWETLDAQKAHCATEHFKALGAIKSEYVADTKINITEIEIKDGLND